MRTVYDQDFSICNFLDVVFLCHATFKPPLGWWLALAITLAVGATYLSGQQPGLLSPDHAVSAGFRDPLRTAESHTWDHGRERQCPALGRPQDDP